MKEFIQGKQFEAEGRHLEAIDAYYRAVSANPSNGELCAAFARAIRFLTFSAPNPFLQHTILHCFNLPEVNPQDLALPAFSLIALMPEYHALCKTKDPLSLGATGLLNDSLFLSLLTKTIVPDPQFEQLITKLRHALLMSDPSILKPFFSLITAIAAQCFLNEYVYLESDEESERIETLCRQLKFPLSEESSAILALLAAYRPLYSYSFAPSLISLKDEALTTLIRTQLIEPQEERALIASIPVLNPIKNALSKKVQEQYEENPYPRWNFLGKRLPIEPENVFSVLFPWKTIEKITRPEVLIAGCGTGRQAIQAALTYKDAHITAIDLSAASLAYAKREANEWKISNITFIQADILDLKLLVKQFDIIEAVGVLHHMENPMEGWKVLTHLLKKGGWINIGLYSEVGRRDICAARNYIAEKQFLPTTKGIRLCRQELFKLPKDSPIKDVTRSLDFFTTSACRDLIFHAQEHRFSIPQIIEYLEELGLEFVGFDLPLQSILHEYHAEYPDDPPEGVLLNWHAFELKHPTTFIGMYQFWATKKL